MTIVKLDTPALVLRTCDENLRSYWDSSFQWPAEGPVSAPDWKADPGCGNGLHGLLWGAGGASYLTFLPTSKWMVVEINQYVQATPDKVKYPEGCVVFVGTQEEATRYIHERAPNGTPVVGVSLTGGDRSTLTGGYGSTLTGGYGSTLTGGNRSTLTGGYGSTLTGGNRSTLTGGYDSTLTGGDRSTLTGGYGSTLTGGDRSTLTGGYGSSMLFKFYDYEKGIYRRVHAEIGLRGEPTLYEAGKAYRCTEKGIIVPA